MSHFTTIRTRIHDAEILKGCLREMGYRGDEEKRTLEGDRGSRPVEFGVTVGKGYGIGFVKGEVGNYEIVADWWGVRGASERTFRKDLEARFEAIERQVRQEYALAKTIEEVKRAGFVIVGRKVLEDKTVKLVVRRFV